MLFLIFLMYESLHQLQQTTSRFHNTTSKYASDSCPTEATMHFNSCVEETEREKEQELQIVNKFSSFNIPTYKFTHGSL